MDEFISAEDVIVSPRGRKVELNAEMGATFKKMKPGQAVRLASSIGPVAKTQRATVSTVIRKNWRAVREDECRIDYDTEGIAQVRVRAAK